jgi:hypothetical protein
MDNNGVIRPKTCKDCEQPLPETRFRRHRNYKDGRMSRCKACQKGRDNRNLAIRLEREAFLKEPRYYWDGHAPRCGTCKGPIYHQDGDAWCFDCGRMITTAHQKIAIFAPRKAAVAEAAS